MHLPVGGGDYETNKARFPFKRNRLRKCVNENRKKRKRRLRWQAASHGCHCFDRAFLLAGACVCCVKFSFKNSLKNYITACTVVQVVLLPAMDHRENTKSLAQNRNPRWRPSAILDFRKSDF